MRQIDWKVRGPVVHQDLNTKGKAGHPITFPTAVHPLSASRQ